MPIWLRRFYTKQIIEFRKAEQEAHEKQTAKKGK